MRYQYYHETMLQTLYNLCMFDQFFYNLFCSRFSVGNLADFSERSIMLFLLYGLPKKNNGICTACGRSFFCGEPKSYSTITEWQNEHKCS